ncbi:FtsX-like permease family protein [Blautia sp. MCC283]|mgnify:FL=1|jgi:putative ABC transport system permease protein|uniref:FtsX-like permease family protein n=1 Tax=Blautia sp. MCC283 TaxID=2592640 RepID=UPI001C0253DC|nr:FtsX-like permease family protein [Blautia sp. MCC283]MBT9842376.1 FtsX-like permease family protein [Blautia sp. MCC283]MDU2616536.1 FtsX-like permease family protein [Ruminococcus sp.]
MVGDGMKALHKDFWMEIRKSKARFISIFLIVALGVAFFSGIQASSPDMRYSGDAYYEAAKLMDLKIQGTLGLTQRDVKAVSDIDGVELAEGSYSTDVMSGEDDARKVLHLEAISSNFNLLTADEGRIPEKSGEIFLDKPFAKNRGYKIGDTISVSEDGDSELLKKTTYTVVGIGSSPLYISFNRGNTTLGSGEVSGFGYILPEDFEQEAFTQIYIMVHESGDVISYTDAYDNLIKKIRKRVEGIEKEQCSLRYEEIVAEANEKLDDARKELEDGKKESEEKLGDAKKKLDDGQKKYEDGKKEYEDGKQQLSDAKKELTDGKQQLADGRKQIEDGWSQLNSAKQQVEDGLSQLNAARSQLADSEAQINEKQSELTAGYEQLTAAKQQVSDGEAQLREAEKTLESKQAELDSGREQLETGKNTIKETKTALTGQKEQCEAGLVQVSEGESQINSSEEALSGQQAQLDELTSQKEALSSQAAELQAQYDAGAEAGKTEEELAELSTQIQTLNGQISAMEEQINAGQAQIDGAQAELTAKKSELAQTRAELESSLGQINEGFSQIKEQEETLSRTEAQLNEGQEELDKGKKELETKKAELSAAKEEIAANQATLDDGQSQLDSARAQLSSGRQQLEEKQAQLNAGQAEIQANTEKLTSSQAELDANEQKLLDGEKEIRENEQKLKDAKKDLEDAKKKLSDGKKEYQDGKKEADDKIAEAQQKIEDAQKEVDDIETPEWILSDRNDLPEYSDFGDNAERLKNIGKVFPMIFFLVAALISLTTMTRMVEEQRTQIGTMKALGYGKASIASKYLSYAFLATVGGSIAGVLFGEKVLPFIIIQAYGIMYWNIGDHMQLDYELQYALIASGAAVICTMGATLFSCAKTLAETPASLMRPPAPKEGKRILIERISFIWKHLSFSWKSSMRNLFRYKKRLFMTIFGIAGSMGLMLVGFGLYDSIMDIAILQYDQIQHYDAMVINDEDATDSQEKDLLKFLDGNSEIDHYTRVQLTKMTAPKEKGSVSIYVYVPENTENFKEDVTLRDRKSHEQYELTDDGAVICEKTASLIGVKTGDEITLEKDNRKYKVKITAVTENYMGHYVYMTPPCYEKTFGEKPEYSSTVYTMKEDAESDLETLGNAILKYPAALSISYTSSTAGQVERMLGSLGAVIWVLIISAGMLAFVVLYNLNNINITERQRELATLKVLGFYDGEVSQYVFRENVLLSFIGILAGAVFGIFLHRYVITTVEVDAVMFGRNIKPISFVYSGLITFGFSMFVNMVMHFKLKKIDMVESLKSVE